MARRSPSAGSPRIAFGTPALVFIAAAAVISGAPTAGAQTQDPDAWDPLLDTPAPLDLQRRQTDRPIGGPGFFIGGGGFLYAGRVRSRLLKTESGLENGAFPGVLITLGGRARIPLEIGFDIGYGLGGRWDADLEAWVWAHDLLLEPRALWHVYETTTWNFVAGAASSVWMFDIGADGVSQTLIGPFGVLGIRRHLDARSLLFLDFTGGVGKDTLAYHTVEPTDDELLETPDARPHRVHGAWYPLLRISAGYRLSGF